MNFYDNEMRYLVYIIIQFHYCRTAHQNIPFLTTIHINTVSK